MFRLIIMVNMIFKGDNDIQDPNKVVTLRQALIFSLAQINVDVSNISSLCPFLLWPPPLSEAIKRNRFTECFGKGWVCVCSASVMSTTRSVWVAGPLNQLPAKQLHHSAMKWLGKQLGERRTALNQWCSSSTNTKPQGKCWYNTNMCYSTEVHAKSTICPEQMGHTGENKKTP